MTKIIFDPDLKKQVQKLDKSVKTVLKTKLDLLEKNPFSYGKVLSGTKGRLRELKIQGYRLYYTIFHDDIVVIICFELENKTSSKKQKKTIKRLFINIEKRIKKILYSDFFSCKIFALFNFFKSLIKFR